MSRSSPREAEGRDQNKLQVLTFHQTFCQSSFPVPVYCLSFVLVLRIVGVTIQERLKAAQGREVQPPLPTKERRKGQGHLGAYIVQWVMAATSSMGQ